MGGRGGVGVWGGEVASKMISFSFASSVRILLVCRLPLPAPAGGGGKGEHSNQQKLRQRSEGWAKNKGGMPLGEVSTLNGKPRGAFVHRWAGAREWGGEMSVNQFEKGRRKEEGGRRRGGRKEEQSIEL